MAKVDRLPMRIFSIVIVLLFVIPIVFGAVYVIIQANQTQGTSDTASVNTTATPEGETPVNENALKGTPLANFTPITSPVAELQKIDTVEGTGDGVAAGATITADYTGALATSGVIFESSLDSGTPATFPLSQVIPGWQEGVPGMKVGGTRRLVIPAAQAYGQGGSGATIPPNSDLVFDITLKSIN